MVPNNLQEKKMFFKRKKDDTEKVLKRIDGKLIKYVSSRDENNVEEIIGRGGRLVVTDTQVAVNCDGKDVFVCDRNSASVSELLSLNGVVITGEIDGKRRSVTAYYTYYNKK